MLNRTKTLQQCNDMYKHKINRAFLIVVFEIVLSDSAHQIETFEIRSSVYVLVSGYGSLLCILNGFTTTTQAQFIVYVILACLPKYEKQVRPLQKDPTVGQTIYNHLQACWAKFAIMNVSQLDDLKVTTTKSTCTNSPE